MSVPEDVLVQVVRQWVAKAENDLTTAAHTLKLGQECPTDTVCFHAQQCIEKYVKAVLVLRLIDFPKTHDLNALIGLLPEDVRPALTAEDRRRFTEYATVMRYPGERQDIPLAEARRSVRVARQVRKELRSRLPGTALARRRT